MRKKLARIIFIILIELFIFRVFADVKKVHFSIDDVNYVLKDITKNQEKYDSLFEHSFFHYLKELHDIYGTICTLYCFYELNDFALNSVTAKYADEFSANYEWLKFGFHSYNKDCTFVEGGGIANL